MRTDLDHRIRVLKAVPFEVRAAAWSWPLIGFGIVALRVLALVVTLHEVTIPLIIAALVTGPLRRRLTARLPKAVAVLAGRYSTRASDRLHRANRSAVIRTTALFVPSLSHRVHQKALKAFQTHDAYSGLESSSTAAMATTDRSGLATC